MISFLPVGIVILAITHNAFSAPSADKSDLSTAIRNHLFKNKYEYPIMDYISTLQTMVEELRKEILNGQLDDTIMANHVVALNDVPDQLTALKDFILENGVDVDDDSEQLKTFEETVDSMTEIIYEVTHNFLEMEKYDASKYGQNLEDMITAFKNWLEEVDTDMPGLRAQVANTTERLTWYKIMGAFAQLLYQLWVKTAKTAFRQ